LLLSFAALLGCSAPSATAVPAPSGPATASNAPAASPSAMASASSAPVASPRARVADGVPAFQVITAGLIQAASSYPDGLAFAPRPLCGGGELLEGPFRWAVGFPPRADQSEPFMVLLCDGSCRPLSLGAPASPASATANASPDTVLAVGGVVKRSLPDGRGV